MLLVKNHSREILREKGQLGSSRARCQFWTQVMDCWLQNQSFWSGIGAYIWWSMVFHTTRVSQRILLWGCSFPLQTQKAKQKLKSKLVFGYRRSCSSSTWHVHRRLRALPVRNLSISRATFSSAMTMMTYCSSCQAKEHTKYPSGWINLGLSGRLVFYQYLSP